MYLPSDEKKQSTNHHLIIKNKNKIKIYSLLNHYYGPVWLYNFFVIFAGV